MLRNLPSSSSSYRRRRAHPLPFNRHRWTHTRIPSQIESSGCHPELTKINRKSLRSLLQLSCSPTNSQSKAHKVPTTTILNNITRTPQSKIQRRRLSVQSKVSMVRRSTWSEPTLYKTLTTRLLARKILRLEAIQYGSNPSSIVYKAKITARATKFKYLRCSINRCTANQMTRP